MFLEVVIINGLKKNKNILNQYELNRKQLGELILDVHKRKPSYGYHRIRKNYIR